MVFFSRVSLLATSTVLFSISRLPIAILMGTPLSSYSANFAPGLKVSLSSNLTEILFDFSDFTIIATFQKSQLIVLLLYRLE